MQDGVVIIRGPRRVAADAEAGVDKYAKKAEKKSAKKKVARKK